MTGVAAQPETIQTSQDRLRERKLQAGDDGTAGTQVRRELAHDDRWTAPEKLAITTERHLSLRDGHFTPDDAVAALEELTIDMVDPARLVARMWELRSDVTAYDAAYVAAAELLECPLLTDVDLPSCPGTVRQCQGGLRPPTWPGDQETSSTLQ
ncbi:hypothetical protein [Amycolatopsis pigmentata]|uniref:PIN domain-containing protein n=1 Tax=Amycolatopsis pigmentata TaxID=450801 RepID=A0ABW5FVV1_9PSEU